MLGPMRAIFENFNYFRYFFGYTRADGRTAEPRSSTFEENIERDRSARTTMTDVGRRHRTVRSLSAHAAAAAGLSAGVDADALHLPLPDGFCSRWSPREAMKAVALARECRADEAAWLRAEQHTAGQRCDGEGTAPLVVVGERPPPEIHAKSM